MDPFWFADRSITEAAAGGRDFPLTARFAAYTTLREWEATTQSRFSGGTCRAAREGSCGVLAGAVETFG